MKPPHWTANRIPDQTGRTFVVTGATSGLGLATTRALARAGAQVILAVRDLDKAHDLAAAITAEHPGAVLEPRHLDLADLESVTEFAVSLAKTRRSLDVLVNNAGVMAPPRTLTAQGHEMQWAVNHLGHFALTGLLLAALAKGRDPRVVTVSSYNHRMGRLRFDDLTGERGYRAFAFYNQSKLANAVFGIELHRRLSAAGSPVRSILAHPGFAATAMQSRASGWPRFVFGRLAAPLAQTSEQGALPQLYAATSAEAASGEFIGPRRFELRGAPTRVGLSATAADPAVGQRLWELSEQQTGIRYGGVISGA